MKTCFISAPLNVDLTVLRSVLHSKKIKTILPFELEITGANYREQIEKAICKADFCIAVLTGGKNKTTNSNVFFELGYAWAKRKRVVLIQSREVELPSDLSGFPILTVEPNDKQKLASQLAQFLEHETPTKSLPRTMDKTKPLSGRAEELISRLEGLGEHATESEFSHLLTSVFRESGIRVVVESGTNEHGYDLAIWVDELEYLIGNPQLVELRKRLSVAAAREIKHRFLANLGTSIGRALLVVFIAGSEKQLSGENLGVPLIVFISATHLVSELKTRSIAAFLRDERNKLVHGI